MAPLIWYVHTSFQLIGATPQLKGTAPIFDISSLRLIDPALQLTSAALQLKVLPLSSIYRPSDFRCHPPVVGCGEIIGSINMSAGQARLGIKSP